MLTLNRFDEVAVAGMAFTLTLVPMLEVKKSYLLSTALDNILTEHFDWEEIFIIKDYWENNKDDDIILAAAFRACAGAG
jgi:hypothetical protein